jgi:MarR family transcriptional regulator, 2-MHQ and catechol-resistance regulon repressor
MAIKRTDPRSSGVHLWLLLWKASKAVEAHARRSVESTGLGLSDFGVLEALLHKGPLPVSALGKKVLLSSGSITVAVDRLEKNGLVERGSDATDRRARIVHLTGEGRTLIRKVFAEHERDMERVFSRLAKQERNTLGALLRKLGREAGALPANELTQEKKKRRWYELTTLIRR